MPVVCGADVWRRTGVGRRTSQGSSMPRDALLHMRCASLTPTPPLEPRRRDVEERSEQLKAISNLSALIAGFALVAFLQFDFEPNAASEGVQLAFGATIALTVLLEANAMVICSLIHASILRTGRSYVSSQEEADFMARARHFAAGWVTECWPSCRRVVVAAGSAGLRPGPLGQHNSPAGLWLVVPAARPITQHCTRLAPSHRYQPGDRPPAPRRNFQAHWQYACESQWRVAFLMFSAGIPVFFANMALAAWIKFDYSIKTAVTMTAMMGLAFAYFLVAQNRWSWHLIGQRHNELEVCLLLLAGVWLCGRHSAVVLVAV